MQRLKTKCTEPLLSLLLTLPFLIAALATILITILITTEATGAEIEHVHLVKSNELTFAEVFAIALDNAPELLESEVRQQQADDYSSVSNSWLADRPSLQLSYFDDSPLDNIGMRELEYGVSLPLRRPSERVDNQALSQTYQEQVDAWQTMLELYIAGKVRSALSSITEAEAMLMLERDATSTAENLLGITSTLFDAGEISQLDVMQARNLLLEQRKRELQAEAMMVDAEREYEVLTGLDIRPNAIYQEVLTDKDEITISHPQLAYLQTNVDLADANISQAENTARGSPVLTIGSRRDRGDYLQNYNESIGVSLSVPFGGKSIIATRTSSARRNKVDAEVVVLNTWRSLNQALHEIEHELFLTKEELMLSAEQNELSMRRWEMSRSAFTQGEVTLAQVVLALQEYRLNQQAHESLLHKQNRLVMEFNQIIGVMP